MDLLIRTDPDPDPAADGFPLDVATDFFALLGRLERYNPERWFPIIRRLGPHFPLAERYLTAHPERRHALLNELRGANPDPLMVPLADRAAD